ncbi:alpha-ribazole phosphatase [Sphingobium sp. OAS761]|uniref:histidine phosphatase family protein n=1 Tax=Sphingobium sp. OAS761 TaxID=2817901 RepID=UPI00209D5CDB|nr:histidine phosphatase family protein [Sphingobium sp. OAS761]MCP1469515.1 alpha-ribazole phosphatase [Sphingobium sp. OAS761]
MTPRVIHMLRHGPPLRTGLLLGHLDEPPRVADCPVMLRRVRTVPIGRIVSSDLLRTSAQAASLARRLSVPLHHDPRWRELDFGDWEGLSPDDIDNGALSRFWDDPDASPPPRGERWFDLCRRVRSALAEVADGTLLITHAGTVRAALSVLTGIDHRGVWALDLPYRALVSVRIWPGEALSGQIIRLETADPA